MGSLIQSMFDRPVKVGLAISDASARQVLMNRFAVTGQHDAPSAFEFIPFSSARQCMDAAANPSSGFDAVFLDLPESGGAAFCAKLREVREGCPNCSVVLVGSSSLLDGIARRSDIALPWRDRFRHYFRYQTESNVNVDSAGTCKDLVIADAIKSRGVLPKYQTIDGYTLAWRRMNVWGRAALIGSVLGNVANIVQLATWLFG